MFAKMDSGIFAGRASLAAMAILFSTHPGIALAADAIAVNSDDLSLPPPEPSRFARFEQKLSDWHVVLGGGAIIVPKYEGEVGIEVNQPLSQSLMVGARASAVFADENHMQAYFGVTPEQSARSGLARYDAGAGLKRADFSVSATYLLNQNWMVRGEAGVGVLVGDAADSPIVAEKIQPSGMLLVGYRF
ncbi:MAG: MipA/OmpV family protein [Mesorhizobium sp.]|nr:MAG: MipA/OmpV family protein [Mesorhizobium sp.]